MTMRGFDPSQGLQGQLQAQQVAGMLGGRYVEKDPSVNSASDAVKALVKRAEELRGNLAKVDGWKAELVKVERMLAAAEAA